MKSQRKSLMILLSMLVAGVASGECTTNLRVPIDWYARIPSSGDVVYCQGSMHLLATYTVDRTGGIHVTIQSQPQHLSGRVIDGPHLGAKYQGTGLTRDTFNVKQGEVWTFINNYRFLGQGQAPNFTVHETWHLTFNANGELTAYVDNVRVTSG